MAQEEPVVVHVPHCAYSSSFGVRDSQDGSRNQAALLGILTPKIRPVQVCRKPVAPVYTELSCSTMSQASNELNPSPSTVQSSSSSGTSTLCSMETLEVSDTQTPSEEEKNSQEEDSPLLWGRLLPIENHFETLDLCKLTYTFGRGDDCDYSFNAPKLRSVNFILAYSKMHFKLTRESTSTGWHTYLEDASSNGTFINGTKVGRNNKQVLNNNDEIGLASKSSKAFVYMDKNSQENEQYPEEVRNRYTISKVLGRGACGEVRLAFEKGTCRKFAIKVILKKTFSVGGKTHVNLSSQVMNEVKVLKALKHPCIIQVEDVIDTAETLFIVLELVAGGELFDRVASQGTLDEDVAKLLFYQLVVAIKYLHQKGITHRDLKPENVLLATNDKETLIKVTDFGLSKFVDANTMMRTFCGTPNYLAPEVIETNGLGTYTQAIDCWSLGVILFICLSGYPPFSDDYKDMNLRDQITTGRYTFPKQYWKGVSTEAIDLVKKLLTIDPQKRVSPTEALDHPWLKDEEMLRKAHMLLSTGSENGDSCYPDKSTKPKLKRQREESDEVVDGDDAANATVVENCNNNKKKLISHLTPPLQST